MTSWKPRAKRPASFSGPWIISSIRRASKGGINPSGELRVKLDLFANIRPAKSRMGVGLTGKPVDLVIFRECTEGFYADRNMFMGRGEFMPTEDMAIAVRKVTARQCERISRVAFEWARSAAGKSPPCTRRTCCISPTACSCARCARSRRNIPDVELDEKIVDAMAALLVRDPSRFDCIVTGNMFGDILSDEASEISGSLGPRRLRRWRATTPAARRRSTAPRRTSQGQDKANPTSLILSAAMLLEWLAARHKRPEFDRAAKAIEGAIDAALQSPDTRTADLKGKLGTRAFAKHVAGLVG